MVRKRTKPTNGATALARFFNNLDTVKLIALVSGLVGVGGVVHNSSSIHSQQKDDSTQNEAIYLQLNVIQHQVDSLKIACSKMPEKIHPTKRVVQTTEKPNAVSRFWSFISSPFRHG